MAPCLTRGQCGDASENEFDRVGGRGSLPVLGVRLDRLALESSILTSLDDVEAELRACEVSRVVRGRGRNVGSRRVERVQCWTHPRGHEGGVFIRVQDEGIAASKSVRIEGNPAHEDAVAYMGLACRLLGVDPLGAWVDRWDVAIDYAAERRAVTVGDPRRETRPVGGRLSPETQYVGARGADVSVVLYDKSRERAVKGVNGRAGVVRFEVRVRPRDPVRLRDLGGVPYPAESFVLSHLDHAPWKVADVRLGVAMEHARWRGVPSAMGMLRCHGVRSSVRDQFRACAMPDVRPSPGRVFAECWPAVVAGVAERLAVASRC